MSNHFITITVSKRQFEKEFDYIYPDHCRMVDIDGQEEYYSIVYKTLDKYTLVPFDRDTVGPLKQDVIH